MSEALPPGETGATLSFDECACLVLALDVYLEVQWSDMPRAGSYAYHAKRHGLGLAYVLRGRLARRALELAEGR